jgi:hypothetical protein
VEGGQAEERLLQHISEGAGAGFREGPLQVVLRSEVPSCVQGKASSEGQEVFGTPCCNKSAMFIIRYKKREEIEIMISG